MDVINTYFLVGPVFILDQPVDYITRLAQGSVSINCTVSGQHPILIEWFFNSMNGQVLKNSNFFTSDSGKITSVLTLERLTTMDEGEYFCRATNNITGYPSFTMDSNSTQLVIYRKLI